ncbi:hypothetical protein I79_017216 [Cricetulus griseus]|uniref:Uncharacterized protein n=1 Tax=Cricetulus griseus TaxID=10029 RepID=G3I1G1_CRIGR|nr:hypothetical protein I79_017216 [Cricetulus griseus]
MVTLSPSFYSLPSPAPAFPLLTGWPGLSYLLYPRPDSFRTLQAFRTLANRILRIHLNSKSKIWNNEKADTVAQHGFGLTAA